MWVNILFYLLIFSLSIIGPPHFCWSLSVKILGVLTQTGAVFTIADHKLEMSGKDQVFVELKKPLS